MAYIPSSDITRDLLAAQFSTSLSIYHTLVDAHIQEIAEGEQIDSTDISVDINGYLSSKFLRRYAAAWVCMELFKDKIGINNNSISDEEKYRVKYEIYKEIVDSMRGKITAEILKNDISSRMSTATSRNVYRG